MIIVGGVYHEQCISPEWNNFYGSGGRAAAAVSGFGEKVALHTFAPLFMQETITAAMQAFNFDITFYPCNASFAFSYLHSLSKPVYYSYPEQLTERSTFHVEGDVVVRFGFMEGNASVIANCAVYDPQSPSPELFSANGSTAHHLAYVLNEAELFAIFPDTDIDSAARLLLQHENAQVALIKRGVFGVRVVTEAGVTANLPAYQTASVFKIGSGDVFTAAFAYHWGVRKHSPIQSAELASKSAAWYCDTRSLPLPDQEILSGLTPVQGARARSIYLAAPFFTLQQRWMVEEVRTTLKNLGADVFSPIHDVGVGDPTEVAPLDLAALRDASVLLALADGVDLGTVFEIGYANAHSIRTFVYSERLPDYQLTMISGTGGMIEKDLATALYKSLWASLI